MKLKLFLVAFVVCVLTDAKRKKRKKKKGIQINKRKHELSGVFRKRSKQVDAHGDFGRNAVGQIEVDLDLSRAQKCNIDRRLNLTRKEFLADYFQVSGYNFETISEFETHETVSTAQTCDIPLESNPI